MLASMGANSYSDIKDSLRHLYLEDARPWLVGFSGGKDSTMLASVSRSFPLVLTSARTPMTGIPTISEGFCFNDACRKRRVRIL
jgi:PP-loop superfamily ATP-utilizing enzyme